MKDTISRCDLFNELATVQAADANEMKGKIYSIIQAMPTANRPQGKWVLDPNGMDWNIPAWRCSRCGFVANYIGVEANGIGRNPMNWAGSKYCPHCGVRMKGTDNDSDNAD